jgi:hypothetical protein
VILDLFIRRNLHTSANIYFLVCVKILKILQALSLLVFLKFYKVLMAYSKKCMRSISIKYLKVGFMGVHHSKPFRFYFTIFWEDDKTTTDVTVWVNRYEPDFLRFKDEYGFPTLEIRPAVTGHRFLPKILMLKNQPFHHWS